MSKKQTIIIWVVAIATYIANIILVSIKGATLSSCIAGWSVASISAGNIIYLLNKL